MTTYSGTIGLSGGVEDGFGAPVNVSGTVQDTISAPLDLGGNGAGTEIVNGSLSLNYTDIDTSGASEAIVIPFSVSVPTFSVEGDSFAAYQQVPVALVGGEFAVALNGTVAGGQADISQTMSVAISGIYQGVAFSGTISGTASLPALAPLTISGTVANQATTASASACRPSRTWPSPILNAGQTDTVTVTLSNAANGTMTNLGGGSFDAATGVYTVVGTAAADTAALDGLVFDPASASQTVTTGFTIGVTDSAGATATDTTTSVVATPGPILTILASFDGTDGDGPRSSLVMDSAGDLFGTTQAGGSTPGPSGNGDGTVFELAATGAGYASTSDHADQLRRDRRPNP